MMRMDIYGAVKETKMTSLSTKTGRFLQSFLSKFSKLGMQMISFWGRIQ